MFGISEIIGITSILSSFPVVCRSVLEIVGSRRAEKHPSAIVGETESRPREKNLCHSDYIVAGSLFTSPKKLALLAQSERPRIRGRVAENPNCPLALLAWLAQDSNAEVRLSVAYNPKVPAILLEWLVQDDCPDVLLELAADYNLSKSLLSKLSNNDNPYVAERAKQTLERLVQANNDSWHEKSVATNESFGVKLVGSARHDGDCKTSTSSMGSSGHGC